MFNNWTDRDYSCIALIIAVGFWLLGQITV